MSNKHLPMSVSALSLPAAPLQQLLSASCSMPLLPSQTTIDHFYDLIPSLCCYGARIRFSLSVLPLQPVDVLMNQSTAHAGPCLPFPAHAVRLRAQTHTLLNAWPILQIITCTCRDPGRKRRDSLPGLVQPLKQSYLLINTSSPLCKRFKVILLKLTFCAWTHLSLPFSLLSDWSFLYKFIKLIPFLPALRAGSGWIMDPCSITFRSCASCMFPSF